MKLRPWEVVGADATTGETVRRVYQVENGRKAEQAAISEGILISTVRPVHNTVAPTIPEAGTTYRGSTISQADWKRLESTIIKGVAGGILLIYAMSAILALVWYLLFRSANP
jgi:hypothetical protein